MANYVVESLYPTFPHNVNYTLNDESLEDFLKIVSFSCETNDSVVVEPSVILRCAEKFHEWSADKITNYSELKARCIGACIEACFCITDETVLVKMLRRLELYNYGSVELKEQFPGLLIDKKRLKPIYDTIQVDHFIFHVASIFATNEKRYTDRDENHSTSDDVCNGRRKYWCEFSRFERLKKEFDVIFFTMSMKWLINFQYVSFEARASLTSLYEIFASRKNFLMALPFSFFTHINIVKKYNLNYATDNFNDVNFTSFRFIRTFRTCKICEDWYSFCCDFDENYEPRYRHLHLLLSIPRRIRRYKPSHTITLRYTQLFVQHVGIYPFRLLDRVKIDSELTVKLAGVKREFEEYVDQHSTVSYGNSKPNNYEVEDNDDDIVDDGDNGREICVVCMISRIKATFILCKHRICCNECALRLLSSRRGHIGMMTSEARNDTLRILACHF